MTITLRIDHIVLDGVPVGPQDIAGLREAVVAELTDLLTRTEPPRRSVHRARLDADPVGWPPGRFSPNGRHMRPRISS